MQWKKQSWAGEYSPSSPHTSRINNHRENQRVDKKLAGLCHRSQQGQRLPGVWLTGTHS